MKRPTLSQLKLVFVDSKHNFFHYLVVLFLKITKLIIFLPVSAYLLAFGLAISITTIKPIFSGSILLYAQYYSHQLPYFMTLKNQLFDSLKFFGLEAPVWWTMVVGLPMIIVGLIIFTTNFVNLFNAIFSADYHRTHCPFCKQPIRIKKNGVIGG
jgi:hypothetical protein